MSAVEGSFEVVNILGLHARAASRLVQLASRFPCEIEVMNGAHAANAKSVMGVLLLCGAKGTWLRIVASGEQAERAVAEIGALIAERFGEAE